jgi:hypothetical protein
MEHEIKWQGRQWIVTARIGSVLIALVHCADYETALEAFCQLAGVQ